MVASRIAEVRHGHALDALLRPRSVAVVGAPGNAASLYARPLRYLTANGFDGPVYPVNPRHAEIEGLRAYADLAALPGPVDLVLLLVPARTALELIPEVASAGAGAAVVFASGFGEAGPAGERMQGLLKTAARHHGVRVLGPNCQGLVVPGANVYASFTPALEGGPIRPGVLAYVGQSGAVGGAVLSLARERGIGLSAWLSTGNQADLGVLELGRTLVEDPSTETLALYVEGRVDAAELRELALRASELGKSVALLRSGTSVVGGRAAASHTGALLSVDAAVDVVIDECGITRARDVDELVMLSHALTALPAAAGPRTVIVTTSGGAGSLAADHATAAGLEVRPLDSALQAELRKSVPDFGAVENPVDVTAELFRDGHADGFGDLCEILLASEETDVLLIVLTLITGELANDLARRLAALSRSTGKPMAVVWIASREQTRDARSVLAAQGIPVFDSPSEACVAIRSLQRPVRALLSVSTADEGIAPAVRQQLSGLVGSVTEARARPLLEAVGVGVPRGVLVSGPEEAADACANLAPPFVLKIQAESVQHKTERRGVVLGVSKAEVEGQVADLLERFTDDAPEGVLVVETAPPGIEILVGVTRSGPDSLPLLTVGLGGTLAELLDDTATTLAPVDAGRARTLLLSLRGAPLLTGHRGSEAVDVDAVARAVANISRLAAAAGPRLRELEVNPLRVTANPDHSVVALDCLLSLVHGGESR